MADSLATVTTFGPTNSEDVWITNIYYGGGMDNNECRIGGWGDYYYCLFKFSLYGQPSIVDYAGLQFYKYAEGGNRSGIYSDRVTSSWTESTRWLNQPSAVNLSTLPPPVDGQWYTIDITSLYNGWQNGSYPNYGIRLRPTSVASDVHNTFRSSEYADANFRPRLVLKYVSSSPSPPPLNTVPTLTLSGANPLSLNVGAQFVEPGYTATDAEDGNITSRVVVSGSVNTAVAGTYTLTYSVTDNGGLSASKTRTVNVVATRVSGTTTITLTSANSTVVWLSSNYYGGGMQNAECRIGGWGDYYYCLIKFNISAPGSKIVLRLYKYVEGGSLSGIILDRVTSDWNGVTKWSAKPASVNITTLPQPVYGQWYEIDITSLYNGWQNGTFPNYGIMLRPTVNGPDVHNTFWSPLYSDATLRPQLVVTTATNSTPPVVQPPPLPSFTGSCAVNGSLNPITLQAGNTAYYGAGYNNIGAVHFFWTGASGGDVSSASQIYNYAGVYNASVMMTDSASPPRQITVNCPQVTVSAPPPPPSPVPFATSCYITPSLIKLGASATYTANASGGYSPYIFNLPGMVYSTSPFNQLTTITPGNIGTQVYQGFVQDSSGQVLKPTCSVTVTK